MKASQRLLDLRERWPLSLPDRPSAYWSEGGASSEPEPGGAKGAGSAAQVLSRSGDACSIVFQVTCP
jgi:hypothetical protein